MSTSPDDELQADVVDASPSPQPVDIDLADLQLVDEVDDEANSVDDEELDDLDDDGLLEEEEVQGDIPDEPEPHELEDGMENGLTADVPDIMDSERPSVSPDSVKEDETDDEEQEEEEEDASQKDEVQILSPSKSKLIGTPGRFRRSGEHQPEEKALAALACRLPTNLEIREGHAFQVFVPDFEEHTQEVHETGRENPRRKVFVPDFEEHTQEVHETGREKCIWKPMKEADPELIEEYCNFCNARYGMHRDRALFILRLANYDFEKAKQKCEVRTVIDDDWDENDIWLFNHCIANFGKNFTKIKSVPASSIVVKALSHLNPLRRPQP
uniref:ELM2 domain-containing protein n=1 Tax=Steinernema glaseri TaxID=37863 RepID=A0A1I7XYL5_9BILA